MLKSDFRTTISLVANNVILKQVDVISLNVNIKFLSNNYPTQNCVDKKNEYSFNMLEF